MTLLIAIAVCLALLGTLLQVRDWYVARQRLMANCAHRWVYFSAWGEGCYWDRRCLDCPRHEPVAREDVPEEWRRRERVAHPAGASTRRDVWPGRLRWPRDSESWRDPVAGSARGSLLGRGQPCDEGECRTLYEDRGSRRDEDNRLSPLGSFQPLERRVGSEQEGNGTFEAAPRNEYPLHSSEATPEEADGSDCRADDERGREGEHGSAAHVVSTHEGRKGRPKQAE